MDVLGIGSALKTYRSQQHIEGKVLAEKLGISRNYYCQLENRKATPSFGLLSRIAKVVGLSFSVSPPSHKQIGRDVCGLCDSLGFRDRETVRRIIKRMSEC